MKICSLQKGRPEDKRSEREERAYDLLDGLNIEYYRLDHEEAADMELCESIGDILGVSICKNLFLCNRQKTSFYLLVMPGDKPFYTKDLSAQINSSRLSFADPDAMLRYLDVTPGSVSVLCLANDTENKVKLLIDEDVLKEKTFGCHPCLNTSSIRIGTDDLLSKILPKINHTPTMVKL